MLHRCAFGPSLFATAGLHHDHFQDHNSLLAITAAMGALSLAACNKVAPTPTQKTANADMGNQPATAPPIASLPLATAMPPAAAPAAPLASVLPPAQRPIRVAPGQQADRYRYTDRAFAMGQAFGDTPPDYTVDYQGTRAWVCRRRRTSERRGSPTGRGRGRGKGTGGGRAEDPAACRAGQGARAGTC